MSGEQFNDCDKSFIRDAMKSVNVPYGEAVVIKRYTGVSSPGDPARGIQPKLQYTLIPTRAIVDSVAQQDVQYSAGIYQIGDLKVSLKEQLNVVDVIPQTGGQSQGDRLLYKGHEYRTVGKFDVGTLMGNEQVFVYVFRKVGNK